MRLFLTALVLLGLCLNVTVASKKLAFHNKCKQTVTAGLLGNGVQYYNLQHDESHTVVLSNTWAGRAWGRYKCYNNKQRSNATQCGAPGTPNPASLAEFAFGAYAGLDFYDLSMVDGYNLPIKISPIGAKQGSNKYDCGSPTCSNLPQCPSTLTVKGSDGKLLGCQSDCSKYGGDKFCCGAGVKNCGGPYAPMIKKKCPTAYSYASDDPTSTFTCKTSHGYTITFCP
ncbi:briggsae CBR-THN-1 protein [Umbelopsis sp. AD052]|nr:briggsae CBR-THN-1 protein [Umbelopsis sp. AD052]